MDRNEVYKEIESMFGLVPGFFKLVPDSTLALEWGLFKKIQVEKGIIPEKYRELIGLGLSAVSKCKYCSFFHTEMAKLNGATEEEVEEAVHIAKNSAGWSTYLNGLQIDFVQFKEEIKAACEFVRTHQEVHA
ncbi:MAG TPA: carboxymuconolactone decarboxylase family protein [Cytophagaceae bacterium]|jgi:AhpD family alkylhydroperoxidase|nr:carboxymuconolactone decarboxylase family protein [Cytophagaceae bacterium]